MNALKFYRKTGTQPMYPWCLTTDMGGVSVSDADIANGSPKLGDMIALNPKNPNDKWLVAKDFFKENYEGVDA